jgi:hypothetical protein
MLKMQTGELLSAQDLLHLVAWKRKSKVTNELLIVKNRLDQLEHISQNMKSRNRDEYR